MSESPSIESTKPEQHIPVFIRAEESLFAKFMCGGFSNGEVLKESRLALEFGVSRRAMREALYQAVGWGVVEYVSFKGFRILDFSLRALHDLAELRDAVETAAARHLAEFPDPAVHAYFERHLAAADAALAAHDQALSAALDIVFHLQLVRMTGNRKLCSPGIISCLMVLTKMAYEFGTAYSLWKHKFGQDSSDRIISKSDRDCLRDNRLVFEAIKAGQSAVAARHIHRHIKWQLLYMREASEVFGWHIRLSELPGKGTSFTESRRQVMEHVSQLLPDLLSLPASPERS